MAWYFFGEDAGQINVHVCINPPWSVCAIESLSKHKLWEGGRWLKQSLFVLFSLLSALHISLSQQTYMYIMSVCVNECELSLGVGRKGVKMKPMLSIYWPMICANEIGLIVHTIPVIRLPSSSSSSSSSSFSELLSFSIRTSPLSIALSI